MDKLLEMRIESIRKETENIYKFYEDLERELYKLEKINERDRRPRLNLRQIYALRMCLSDEFDRVKDLDELTEQGKENLEKIEHSIVTLNKIGNSIKEYVDTENEILRKRGIIK